MHPPPAWVIVSRLTSSGTDEPWSPAAAGDPTASTRINEAPQRYRGILIPVLFIVWPPSVDTHRAALGWRAVSDMTELSPVPSLTNGWVVWPWAQPGVRRLRRCAHGRPPSTGRDGRANPSQVW